MEYEVIGMPAMMVIGIERPLMPGKQLRIDVHEHWDRFHKEKILEKIPNKISNEILGLYCDYENGNQSPYQFVIGCKVSSIMNIPKGMVAKIIPESRYAMFHAQGEFPKSVQDVWDAVWKKGLKRTFTGDFELYGKKFNNPDKGVEVYVAIDEYNKL